MVGRTSISLATVSTTLGEHGEHGPRMTSGTWKRRMLESISAFVSVFGSAEQQKTGLRLVEQCRPRVQDHIAKSVILKYTPSLRFVTDDSIARGNRVLSILDELEHENPDKSRQ